MHVTFGLCLDDRQGPSTEDFFNRPVLGRLGFLSLLETYLGLAAPDVAKTKRVAIYLGCLQEAERSTKRFYSASLATDRVGTASSLLAWRDDWYAWGWLGNATESDPQRIRDMAEVEALAKGQLPPSEAERLAAVAAALTTDPAIPIQSVTLVDEHQDFPRCWQRVLELLPNVSTSLPAPQGAGDLRVLQNCAMDAIEARAVRTLLPRITDGSVQFVRSLSSSTAQHWMSAVHREGPEDRLVLAEESGSSLDAVLTATGGAGCGFRNPSSLRPALQALGLAIDLCWAPLDVNRLVDFLTHPVGPFRRSARARLAQAVAEQPGIGGPKWLEAKQAISNQDDGPALVAEIEYWLEGERWQQANGIPIAKLLDRVDQMRERFRRRMSDPEFGAAIYAPAHRQCAAVFEGLRALQRLGQASVLPRDIEQLIYRATPGGAASAVAEPQANCMRSASRAEACIEPADEVVWWMPGSPSLAAPRPWSVAEVECLTKLGVALPDPARQLDVQTRNWLRPLLVARKRFVMVLPPAGHEVHPVRQLLAQICPELETKVIDLDSEVSTGMLGTLSVQVPKTPFPVNPPLLQLPSPVPLPQRPQSYTSLTELFNNPALFVLKRVAGLQTTSTLSIEEGNRLLGTLAHRAFELLFQDVAALEWSNDQVADWFGPMADTLLRTEGAVLLMRGAGVSEQRFRTVCLRAMTTLLQHLRSAGATRVRTEVKYEGVFASAPFEGKVDLVVELANGVSVVIDVKWSGDSYYAAVLREGEYLQLALYSSLIDQQTGTPPAGLGYFILDTGSLYMDRPGIFPGAQVRAPRNGMTATQIVAQAVVSHVWRAGQLAKGEVASLLDKATPADQGPTGSLRVEDPRPWDREHLILLGGWE